MASLHEDRRRAESFGDDAERYDRARPSYPNELVDDLTSGNPRTVLDVGCGTGIAGRLFAARGCDVLGVEMDPRMAEVARRSGLEVEVAPFEKWDPKGRKFDLLVSGQAWHWINPEVGVEKAAGCLNSQGHFAAFWNHHTHRPEVMSAFEPVYLELAPEILENSPALGGLQALEREHSGFPAERALSANRSFEGIVLRRYRWTKTYTTDQWLDYLLSTSDHHTMDERRRDALVDGLRKALGRLGDRFEVDGMTNFVSAKRV
ncbi:MAG TPA: class I SAM-dependent methyltransferase [Acidimicrobiales bacterium]|nr:class I SAM-dependent methyltransferase [Acidimicrobiales bacterium]